MKRSRRGEVGGGSQTTCYTSVSALQHPNFVDDDRHGGGTSSSLLLLDHHHYHHFFFGGCSFSNRVSHRGLLSCGDASRLTRCHRAFVSNSCHFFRTPLPIRARHTQSLRDADQLVQEVPSRDGYSRGSSRIVQRRRWMIQQHSASCMTSAAHAAVRCRLGLNHNAEHKPCARRHLVDRGVDQG